MNKNLITGKEKWYFFGNCFSQDMCNIVNESKTIDGECFWLSSPITVNNSLGEIPSFLIDHENEFNGNLESRFFKNQFLKIEGNPDRVVINLFHNELGHYKIKKTNEVFFLFNTKGLKSEIINWLSTDCEKTTDKVNIDDYILMVQKIYERFCAPIDLFVRPRLSKNETCYLEGWEQNQEEWINKIKKMSIPNLRIIFLDDYSNQSYFPYFRVEKIYGHNLILSDKEHFSEFGLREIVNSVYGINLRLRKSCDEFEWSKYFKSILNVKWFQKKPSMPKSAMPVKKYLLRSLKEVAKQKNMKLDFINEHKKNVLEVCPDTPFYERYITQCDEILKLRRKK